ncbi:kinesin-like protein KIF16B isoform X2 [Littorina saxatilis]|uniref:kinesin-like protein KIF16B isoform X2 n=1 Tax=Littorina saxatilis TaxID=31220 RepID=UPI0038B4C78E
MTSVKVAVRVRPLNQREDASSVIIEMEGNTTKITNPKVPEMGEVGDHGRDHLKVREFTFDHSFWSARATDQHFITQEQVFESLGLDVVSAAYEGYNVCVFAYGQTGSGKTFTMMGSQENPGLIPRFCEEMFARMHDPNATYRTQVSYLEIYNEKVRDLLKYSTHSSKPSHKLRIREHPKDGPYVQDLSQHTVVSFEGIAQLMQKGNNNRTTAATLMNDVSSRSHAIFTITFTQAKFEDGLPSERQSKIHLVDLAGSERADASGATGQRLKEGGSINRSLVTLGNVISVLAEASSEERGTRTRGTFIPYRDSVLTWLLKDSLGGNAKTIMIATVSPADINYAETMSTLRYANRAKNIINRPTVNEDANVRLIRELREEIARLKALVTGNTDNMSSPKVQEKLHENEARIKVLTEEWADKWRESASILQEEKNLELRKEGVGVILDSTRPHLITVDDDVLATGIMLYHLKEGITTIGTEDSDEPQDISISGQGVAQQHCVIEYRDGVVTMHPIEEAICHVNGHMVREPVRLNQGEVILLGKTNMFRFNHPAEAQKMKQMRKALSTLSLSKSGVLNNSRTSLLSHSLTDLYRSNDSLSIPQGGDKETIYEFEETHREELEVLDARRHEVEEMEEQYREKERAWHKQKDLLEDTLETKEHQLADLQGKLLVIKETMSPARSIEDALQRLETQEETQLQETRTIKEELKQELQEMTTRHACIESSVAIALSEVEQQVSSRQVQISALQDESEIRRKGLQNERKKEEQRTEELRSELTAIRGEMKVERDRLLSENVQLKAEYDKVVKEESNLKEQQDKLDQDKNAQWKTILDGLSEENYRIEEAWQDLTEQEAIVNRKLASGMFASDRDRMQCENDKDHLLQARALLKEEEEKIAAKQQKEMERVEGEMEKWTQQKENEVSALEKKRNDLVRHQSKEMTSLFSQEEAKRADIKAQQEKCCGVDQLLKSLEKDVQRQILDLKEEQQTLISLRDKKRQERAIAEEERSQREAEIQQSLKELEESSAKEMKRIEEERRRLLGLQQEVKENQENTDYSGSGAAHILKEREQELEQKSQECNELQGQISKLREELSAQEKQQEQEHDKELDAIEFKKLQLQEMERQERINALVEQEVKRRLFEEKVEREKQRRVERDKERQDREKEIQKLKSSHERELRQLRAKLEQSNGLSKSNPYGNAGAPDSSMENRRKLVRQLSTVGPPPTVEVTIPNYALRGAGRDSHYEYEVKMKIGDESWSVFRRYSKFRELHQTMKKKHPNVEILVFPPRKLFHKTERVAAERRVMLEQYLSNLVELCQRCKDSPLHPERNRFLTKHILADFDPFFRRGLFEHTRHVAS